MNGATKSHQLLTRAARFNPSEIKKAVSEVEGFNAKFAVVITRGVGTMACAYAFSLIALLSLPAILVQANVVPASTFPHFIIEPGLIIIVAWIAQTFIQLVLLSIIMVGQSVQSLASDARSEKTFTDTETILDRLDTHTAGGLREVLEAIQAIGAPARATPAPPQDPRAG